MNIDRIIFYVALIGIIWIWTLPEDRKVHTVPERHMAKRIVL